MPQTVCTAVTTIDDQALTVVPLHAALLDVGHARVLLPQLAARDGALVPVVITDEASTIPLWRLVAERAFCMNTAAAGGNASLMTLGS